MNTITQVIDHHSTATTENLQAAPAELVYEYPGVVLRPFRGSKKLLYETHGEPPKVAKIGRDAHIYVYEPKEFRHLWRKVIIADRRKTRYTRYNIKIV